MTDNRITITQITSDCKGDDYKNGTVEYRYNIGDAICIGKADYLTIIDIGKVRMIMRCPSTNPTKNDHKALCLAGKIIQYAKDRVLWVSDVIGLGMTFGDDDLINRKRKMDKVIKKYSRTECRLISKVAFKIMEAWQRLNEEKEYCGLFNPIKYAERTEVASKEAFKLAEKFYTLMVKDNE